VDIREQIIHSISDIAKSNSGLRKYERQLAKNIGAWFDDIEHTVNETSDEQVMRDAIVDISSFVDSLLSLAGNPQINELIGRALTFLLQLELKLPGTRDIMRRLAGVEAADYADKNRKRLLVINPGMSSTKVAVYDGLDELGRADLHLSLDDSDTVDTRVQAVTDWITKIGVEPSTLNGIACRSGFFKPVPTGTYRVVPEMFEDIEESKINHPSNMSLSIARRIAELSGRNDILFTTSNPSVSDELEMVERLTGFARFKRDGTRAHYINHKAVMGILASLLNRPDGQVNAITAHLGNGISIALQRNGQITSVLDGFSGVPSSHRCGPLDLPRLVDALKTNEINMKELERAIYTHGGLLSLAGTDDFRTLDAFRHKGASDIQKQKIDLLFEFFARQITASMLKLTADGNPVEVMALIGGLVNSQELVQRIRHNLGGRYPLVVVPRSIERESIAAGLLRGFANPATLKDYVRERNELSAKRAEEDRILDTVVFARQVIYRKKDSPILTIDELIDATCATVREHFLPTIAIVGANNEEAILAAKRANEEGSYRIAKFMLVGDSAAINQIAYEYDLVIDNDNFTIVDTDDPVGESVKLVESGQAQILMKGKMHTEHVLRGVFQFLKSSGRLKSGELISHVFVMDIPVRNKLLLISDAAVNTYPDEAKRIKIIENSLRVARNLNIVKPKVAVISAIEAVNKSIESSIQAERIAEHFANREDCIVEGPLSFDVAMDQHIAQEKNYKGRISGTADILIMPDIDAGNVLYKSLTTQSKASCAGVIICGDLPLVLTSRGDSARSKLASISLAVKMFFDTVSK
jgi:butyrate kinase